MKKIANYSVFRAINELDTTGTYLSGGRERYAQTEYPKFRQMFGKVFADAPTTSGVDYGLKYVGSGNEFNLYDDSYQRWDVVFPDDFYKHFVPKGENVEEWLEENEEIVGELMSDLSGIEICAEAGLNRTHFPGGIRQSLKGLGLGYIIYEGLVRYLGYASSKSDASNAAQKVWSQIADDPDFVGMIANDMILVFTEDFEHKSEVLAKALDDLGLDFDDIKDNSDVEEFLNDHDIDIDDELLKIDFMEKFKENIVAARRIKEENNLTYEGETAARRIKEKLFGDPDRFKEDELRAIKEKVAEIREYMKDPSKERLVAILKSNGIEVKEGHIDSDLFIGKLESCLKDSFEVYSKSSVRTQVAETINAMKQAIIEKYTNMSVNGIESLVPRLQEVFDSNKEKLEELEDELDLRWVSKNSNFNHRSTSNLLIGTSAGKYTLNFGVGRDSFGSVLIYDKPTISPSKIPLDIIQLFKYFAIEAGLKTATDTDAFVESKKADLEKMDILISKSYKWAGNAFSKLKIGQHVDSVVMKPIEHFELAKKLKLTDQEMKMKNAYKYLAKGLQKAYLEGGYAKALDLYETQVKQKLQEIDVDVFDDPDYGLFKDRRPDAKYPAKEHIERRLKAYKEAEDFNAARAAIKASIDKSAASAKADIDKRGAVAQAQSPKEAQAQAAQKKAQEELEEKPIEKRSFIKRFMDFFN
jgi:hypothetical protein